MARLLFWILVLPVAAAVVAFAVTNRADITLDLWPAPYVATVPVWALALGGGLVGFLFGGAVMWRAGSASRVAARAARSRTAALERELVLEKEKVLKAEKTSEALQQPPRADALPAPL